MDLETNGLGLAAGRKSRVAGVEVKFLGHNSRFLVRGVGQESRSRGHVVLILYPTSRGGRCLAGPRANPAIGANLVEQEVCTATVVCLASPVMQVGKAYPARWC